MALTTYFPKRIRQDFDQFFETEVPPKALEPLLRRAAEARVGVHVGFCEKADGKYFNTALLTDRDGRLCGTFRKIHLPGTKSPDGFAQVHEPYYFAHGDTGYRVFDAVGAKVGIAICQDRRYPESYRALALQGAEIILIGYNTPISPLALDLNELCMRAGAYANLSFVVGVAKAGVEDGVELIAGSCIIDPQGQVLARAATFIDARDGRVAWVAGRDLHVRDLATGADTVVPPPPGSPDWYALGGPVPRAGCCYGLGAFAPGGRTLAVYARLAGPGAPGLAVVDLVRGSAALLPGSEDATPTGCLPCLGWASNGWLYFFAAGPTATSIGAWGGGAGPAGLLSLNVDRALDSVPSALAAN